MVETCDFVSMAEAMKIETGIDAEKCYKIEKMMERILGRKLSSFTASIK